MDQADPEAGGSSLSRVELTTPIRPQRKQSALLNGTISCWRETSAQLRNSKRISTYN